jgi:hypothetical protein
MRSLCAEFQIPREAPHNRNRATGPTEDKRAPILLGNRDTTLRNLLC